MATARTSRRLLALIAIGAAVIGLVAGILFLSRDTGPRPGSAEYEDVVRAFHGGVVALEVGLIEDARERFARAADLAPQEPAVFANLAVAHLRLGQLDEAAAPIERALALAPDHGGVALLAGRFETTRGRLDEGLVHLRRAVDLDPGNLRARFTLAEEVDRSGLPDAGDEAQALVDAIVERAPDNLAALVERARLAARAGDLDRLRDSAARLEARAGDWPPLARQQLDALQAAAAAGDFAAATRTAAVLRNVLLAVPAFLESLEALRIPAELIAEPFEQFLVLAPARALPDAPDLTLAFDIEPLDDAAAPAETMTVAYLGDEEPMPVSFAADAGGVRRIGGADAWAFPGLLARPPLAQSLLPVDWDNDFLTDLLVVGPGGVRLLAQGADGTLTDVTERASAVEAVTCDCVAAWAADVEMDGDIDIVLAVRDGAPRVLRNRGDGTWDTLEMFPGVTAARDFVWADLDQDADPDAAFLDAAGALHVFVNRQAGAFVPMAGPEAAASFVALGAADVNADGRIDLMALDGAGVLHRLSLRGDSSGRLETLAWEEQAIATWDGFDSRYSALAAGAREAGRHRLLAGDLDNNGALDVVASGPAGTQVWLAGETHDLQAIAVPPDVEAFAVADADGDGRLELFGLSAGRPVRLRSRGERDYHWMTMRARAQAAAGDQRINSRGVGGDIEIRSGLLAQKQVLTGAPAHFGLGTRTAVDVARVVWPNGVAQAEFDLDADETIVAEQRLKGSCPWVFAWDGTGMAFVTDFLWRSPLGLRINARDTAGVTQTEDWVRIRGDQLVPRGGMYDLRVTAELWETHYFDHLSLLVVDAPVGVEVFVDERFSPADPPALAVQAVGEPRPVAGAWDDAGREVTALVARRDARYLVPFARGAYQGIAGEHAVEIELEHPIPADRPLVLLAHGWVYPTDSSINVAIGQGGHVGPQGVSLEALDADGRWTVVSADIGFPAGKDKTMIVELRGAAGARRLRLRTNLEISWDWLATAERVEAPLRTERLPARAELRYRGFSETVSPRGEAPETPLYGRLANTAQRWRDLTGYYTRFGDVGELVAATDDRYVIVNAGDELRLQFDAPPEPPAGWHRTFVFIGDGWNKDGDYNTRFSQTVLPLPSHGDAAYATPPGALEDDPVYRRHRGDWERYHTRFVTPRTFVRGLRPAGGPPPASPEVADAR